MHVVSPEKLLYPGEARNFAINFVKCNIIAFLDVNTLPRVEWLELAYNDILTDNKEIICGLTQYFADSSFEQSVIDSTYGRIPLKTVPGSLMTLSYFNRIGHFLPKIRSGEDTDWLIRSFQFNEAPPSYSTPLLYYKVPSTFYELFLKWFRNYSSCASICFHLQYQRLIYICTLSFLLILAAYNWNSVMASWNLSNPYYAPNVTKIVLAFIPFMYLLFRGFYLPLKRGVPLMCLLPFRVLRLGLVCFVIDFSKLIAFLYSRSPGFSLLLDRNRSTSTKTTYFY